MMSMLLFMCAPLKFYAIVIVLLLWKLSHFPHFPAHLIRAAGKYELPFYFMRGQFHLSFCLSFWKVIRVLIKISDWDFVDKFVTWPGAHQCIWAYVAAWDDMTMPWMSLWSEEVLPGEEQRLWNLWHQNSSCLRSWWMRSSG